MPHSMNFINRKNSNNQNQNNADNGMIINSIGGGDGDCVSVSINVPDLEFLEKVASLTINM